MSQPSNQIESYAYFPTEVYILPCPEFLDLVRPIADEYIENTLKEHPAEPNQTLFQSHNMNQDVRLGEFMQYVSQTGWNILDSQGYAMEHLNTFISELWVHDYKKHGDMHQHVHGNPAQIVGMYFLEVPDNSNSFIIHDPRPGKLMTNLPEKNISNITSGTSVINFTPKPGQMYFTNSWLPHSFTKNLSDKSFKMVHFSIIVAPALEQATSCPAPAAEII